MLSSWKKKFVSIHKAVASTFEPLENRRLMSGGPWGFGGGPRDGFGHGPGGGPDGGPGGPGGPPGGSITFSLAPTAVQTGLTKLAAADSLAAPTSTGTVILGNSNGVETYTIIETGTGTVSQLTVDQLGDAVTAPTHTTTTWATLSGTGTGSDSAAATEISTIATALSLTAPASTDTVDVTTSSTGAVTYSIHLNANASSSTTTNDGWGHDFGALVSVDASGNPVGNQRLPFSVFSAAIQTGLNALKPTGATALPSTSTQNVDVATIDGVVTYSTTFSVSGIDSTVTVGIDDKAISLPGTATTTFSALSSSLQTELQTLATADGVTGTIASNQSINVLTETNGTIIYSATLSASKTSDSGGTFTLDVTVSVDPNGNPTVLPRDGHFGFGFAGNGGDCSTGHTGTGDDDSGSSNGSGGSTNSSNGSSAVTITPPAASTTTAGTTTATAASSVASTYTVGARLLGDATAGLGMLGGYFVQFAPSTVSSAVKADLTKLQTDTRTLASDIRALSKTQKGTLIADEKAIATAIKAASASLATLESTLKTDSKTWAATLRKDQLAIRKDRKNATALAADKATLASDENSAFAAVVKDQGAIASAINSNSAVITAQQKLATDLPTIGTDQATLRADQAQLVSDV
jgi:hypothetical protein